MITVGKLAEKIDLEIRMYDQVLLVAKDIVDLLNKASDSAKITLHNTHPDITIRIEQMDLDVKIKPSFVESEIRKYNLSRKTVVLGIINKAIMEI